MVACCKYTLLQPTPSVCHVCYSFCLGISALWATACNRHQLRTCPCRYYGVPSRNCIASSQGPIQMAIQSLSWFSHSWQNQTAAMFLLLPFFPMFHRWGNLQLRRAIRLGPLGSRRSDGGPLVSGPADNGLNTPYRTNTLIY